MLVLSGGVRLRRRAVADRRRHPARAGAPAAPAIAPGAGRRSGTGIGGHALRPPLPTISRSRPRCRPISLTSSPAIPRSIAPARKAWRAEQGVARAHRARAGRSHGRRYRQGRACLLPDPVLAGARGRAAPLRRDARQGRCLHEARRPDRVRYARPRDRLLRHRRASQGAEPPDRPARHSAARAGARKPRAHQVVLSDAQLPRPLGRRLAVGRGRAGKTRPSATSARAAPTG